MLKTPDLLLFYNQIYKEMDIQTINMICKLDFFGTLII